MSEFESDFVTVLEEVKGRSNFIGEDVVIADEFGLAHSLCRGFTIHARNMRISNEDIQLMNWWRAEAKADGQVIRLDMLETYSSLAALVPLFLEITKAL